MKFLSTLTQHNTSSLDVLAQVGQLSNFDMIYVYHLLSIGSKLQLKQVEKKLNNDLVYTVQFNHFKLGYITLSNFSKSDYIDELELDATIFSMTKQKYLPLDNLEICIQKKALKMVS